MTKIFTSLLALALITISCAKQTKEQGEVNTHWTKTIVLQNIPDSISKNLLPNVKYIGPGGMEISGLAYFHSCDSLVLRFIFPEKEKWTWQLTCENQLYSSIIKASGEVDVTEYCGENKLYIKWSPILYHAAEKPFINTEARYDNEFTQKEMSRLPRSCAYWSILNGSAGYTHGCAGIWNWGVKSDVDPQGDEWSWEKGLAQKSTLEMKYLSEFMSIINWFNLVPAMDMVQNQPKRWSKKWPVPFLNRTVCWWLTCLKMSKFILMQTD